MRRILPAVLVLAAALPAAAQERGGLLMRNPVSVVDQIDANRGCPMSATSVAVGVNRATGAGSLAQQQLGTLVPANSSGCRPLVSTQVVAGVNMALGGRSAAGQTIVAQGPRGVLGSTTYSRGYNVGYGAGSSASQHILNQIGR